MRILIADKVPESGHEALRALGHEVTFNPDLGADDLPAALAEGAFEILVVRSTKVTEAALVAGARLSLVIRAGAGVNTIDLEAASRRGTFVANCPGKNAIAVAELVMGLMLALDRRIPEASAELAAGSWNKKKYGKGVGLKGRRLGLIGFGNIAVEVARRARAFDMRVATWSLALDHELAKALDVEVLETLDELLTRSDILSVHVPYNEHTRHLIDAPALAKLPDGALLIHTARGGVVDDKALGEAVKAGRLRAGLDVWEGEPSSGKAAFDNPLRELDGIYGTPHIGASTAQAAAATADEVVRIVDEFGRRGVVPNVVNIVQKRAGHHTLVVRHLDRVGVLAHILDALRKASINVQEMQNVVFRGDNAAASATITLANRPAEELLAELRANEHVLAVDLRSR